MISPQLLIRQLQDQRDMSPGPLAVTGEAVIDDRIQVAPRVSGDSGKLGLAKAGIEQSFFHCDGVHGYFLYNYTDTVA